MNTVLGVSQVRLMRVSDWLIVSWPHNCNAHQLEGRVWILKYYLQMQVVSAPCAFKLQTHVS